MAQRLEYIGFKTSDLFREYTLHVTESDEETRIFTLAISLEAFLSERLRYQDAPQICYSKLQRELAACGGKLSGQRLLVTDDELEEFRAAHAPKTRVSRW